MRVVFKNSFKPVFGIQEPQPIVGAMPGKLRIRMRAKDVAKLFIKTEDGIRCFILKDCGDHWSPELEMARNHRPPPVPSVDK